MPKPEDWKGSDLRSRAEVVGWLNRQGGEIHDPAGLIVGRMRAELGKGRSISQLLADMEADGMLKREVRGRRTMMLKLLDDWGLASPFAAGGYQPPPEARRGDGAALEGLAGVNLEQLADTLLAIVVKRATAPVERGHAEVAKLTKEVGKLHAQVSTLQGERAELKDSLLLAREAEKEQRDQADRMRESLAKFSAQAEKKPRRGDGGALVDRLDPSEKRLLKQLMESLPKG